MEFRKNDILTLDIEDCGVDGEGIGKADGFTVFVKDAVIGDRIKAKIIKAKKNYGYGRLMEVITPSPYRVKPACSIARQCGGCQLQALSYEQQLKFKEKKVRGHLERIGGFQDLDMEPIMGMEEPYHYRNKAQFPVGKNKDGKIITGFYAGRTHSIIDNRECILGVKQNKEVLDRVIEHMEKYHVQPYDETTGKGFVRHIMIRYGFHTDEMMVCLILNGDKIPAEKALEYAGLTGNETVWDLYCGIGTISLFLAQKAKFVRGVEIVPQAIDNARENAKLNGIENVEFFVGKAEEVLPREYEKNGVYADVIVVDPPRKGCDEVLLNTILKMKPERVVYVSCDSATLARDLKVLCAEDYELMRVSTTDMFPQGVHVETVCLLSRK